MPGRPKRWRLYRDTVRQFTGVQHLDYWKKLSLMTLKYTSSIIGTGFLFCFFLSLQITATEKHLVSDYQDLAVLKLFISGTDFSHVAHI